MRLLPFYIFVSIGAILCFVSCTDPCENITCPANLSCSDGVCECKRGFSGENCLKENICITQNIKCQNGGICQNGECNCAVGYSGTNCEIVTANIVWERHYGGSSIDKANSIQQTKDGGYIVVGYTMSNDGDVSQNKGLRDIWILKLDKNGNIKWEKNYGGSNWDTPRFVQQTTDGGYIVAGYSYSNDGDVEKNSGRLDYWILKLDSSGNKKWSKSYGGDSEDITTHIKQTFDDGYIVAGHTNSNNGDIGINNGGFDYWIIKLNNTGDLVWEKNYGGTSNDHATSILQIEDGSYIVAGYSTSNDLDVKANNGKADCWISKLDSNGDINWSKNYGEEGNDYAYSMQQTNNGKYIIAGATFLNNNEEEQNLFYDNLILKLDRFGTVEWKTTFGTTGNDIVYSIEQTLDGAYTVAGETEFDNENADYYIVKLQAN